MTSRDYWKRRSLKLEQLLHSRADETVQAVGRRYQTAQKAISKQVDKVFTAYAKNGALNAETAQRLLSQKETEQAREELLQLYQQATGDAKKALWTRLSAPAYSARISRLQALADSIYAQARLVGMDEESLLQARLMDTYEQAYYRTIFDEQQFIGRSFDFTQLDNRQIQAAIASEWSGDSWNARIWNNNDAFATAVEDTVTVGLLSGLRYDEMQDMLEDVIGTDDTEGARYRSARLIRTECAHVANQGHLMGYKAAGLEYYRFLATLDQRTDEECGKLDMQRFAIDEAEPGVNFPPMHPNCRCTTMPDDSPEELVKIKRFARDPTTGKGTTVPANMTYQEWRAQNVGVAAGTKTSTKSNGIPSSAIADDAEVLKFLGADARDDLQSIIRRSTIKLENGFACFPEDDKLNEYVKRVKPLKTYFDVAMHGTSTAVGFGTETTNMSPRLLAAIIRHSDGWNGQKIRLLSCSTGERQGDNYCFAEELANALGVNVRAPNDTLFIDSLGRMHIGEGKSGAFVEYKPNERGRRK